MVNTFIPYSNFKKCAAVLDNKRLGKQRVEAKQILNILLNETKTQGWRNHVVTLMWKGHEEALKYYYNCIVEEWIKRGFENNMPLFTLRAKPSMPWFVKNASIQMSHRASLIRKDPSFYKQIFTKVPTSYLKYKYIWPAQLNEEQIKYLKAHPKKLVDVTKFAKLYEDTQLLFRQKLL